MTHEPRDIFRKEALEHNRQGRVPHGDVLRLSSRWTRLGWWVVAALAIGGVLFVTVVSVDEYSSGVAVVRAHGWVDLNALETGVVVAVQAEPGRTVEAGDVLVQLEDGMERAELNRLQREIDLLVADRLRQRSPPGESPELNALTSELRIAEHRLASRAVRAPFRGVVADVRARVGQPLEPGEMVVRMEGESSGFRVLSFFTGDAKPHMVSGMPLRLELRGYPGKYLATSVSWVAQQAIGPAEARRILGPEIADAVLLTGSVVLAEAEVSERIASELGFDLHDGMLGTAEVRTRRDSILYLLIPGLRELTGRLS